MEKIILPIKTKIAAWWMIIFGGISLVVALGGIILTFSFDIGPYGIESFFITIGNSVIGVFAFFLPGLFILQRKRWFQTFAIIILLVSLIIFLFGGLFITLKINWLRDTFRFLYDVWPPNFGAPFILLLLDRKNFWKIAS